MELKRYVMNSKKEIYDLELEKTIIGTDCATLKYGTFLETSNNILDLVEVGDLVQCENVNFKTQVTYIKYEENIREFNCDQIWDYWFVFRDKNIIAFWKLQPNGDYKKYEVK